ncbi:hypothetical protein BH20BAC1_BH20BAC1_07540 [soil metagenome]
MKHFTYISLFIVQSLLCTICFAQREKIDSLKNILPLLKDSARINCLNKLSETYHWFETDSAAMYAKQALKEADALDDAGHLLIEIYQDRDCLCCKITDDGIGRKKAKELKSKSAATHKSMGMRITADRIAMLQQNKQLDTTIKITDLVLADGSAGGTEVFLKIPITQ